MDRIKLNNRNKSVMLSHSYGRISHTSFLEVWITKLLAKNWVRKGWKEIKAGKRVRGWLRGRGCVGDEEVRGQRSAPPVISPAPERQSRPGQRRFRCQRETTDWQDQAGPLLRSVPLGPFILPSLPFPVTPPWPIPPFLQTLLALLAVCLPTAPQPCHPLVLSLLPFPPLTFFFTPQAKHYHSVSLSRPGWLGQLSVGLHVFSPPSCAHIHSQKHPRAPICTQVVGMQPKVWQEHSEYLRSFYILGLIFRVVAMCWKSGHHQTKTSPLDKGYDHDCERKFCTTAEHLYFMLQDYCPTMHISDKAREVSVLMPISWNWPVTSSKWSVAMLVWTTSFEGQKFVSRERLLSRCSWFY